MHTMPNVGAFKMHLALMVLVGLWLTVAEYVMEVPFVVTLAVVVALILISGLVTSIRVDRLAKYCKREVLTARRVARRAEKELNLVVAMLPSLRAMYDTLCLLEANTTYVVYEFSRWLAWALDPKHTNVKEWLQTCYETGGAALAELHGVCDELDGLARQRKECMVARAGHAAYVEAGLLRLSRTNYEGNDEQNCTATSLPERNLATA